jgi:hypothetical protein
MLDHERKVTTRAGKERRGADPRGRGIAPTCVKLYALGKGGGANTGKDAMVLAAERHLAHWCNRKIENNNEADALWLLAMLADLTQYPLLPGWPDKNRAALRTIKWPPP